MNAVITVVGHDTKGIISKVSSKCAELGANIVEISQSVLKEYFAMIMLVDLADCQRPFHELSEELKTKGMERSLDIHIQRQDIFEAMHRI